MSNIRKSFVSENKSIISDIMSLSNQASKTVITEKSNNNGVGSIKPMNQNVIIPSDVNDQPMIDEDPLKHIRKNSNVSEKSMNGFGANHHFVHR